MKGFIREIIAPLIAGRRWTSVCEIGASDGGSTDLLLAIPGLSVTVLDPCLDRDLSAKYAGNPRVTVRKGNSLDVLPGLEQNFEAILIDGDHNWYTVRHELGLIAERGLLQPGGMIFLDDVGWPYGRRDMYYRPETIPAEFRHDYRRCGMVRGQSALSARGGWNPEFYNAAHEGGPKNGVLTAVEDFLREHRRSYQFARLRGHSGLGILHRRKDLREDVRFLGLAWRARLRPAGRSARNTSRNAIPL